MHKGSRDNLLGKEPNPELDKEFSNELQVKKDTPPHLLFWLMTIQVYRQKTALYSMKHCVKIRSLLKCTFMLREAMVSVWGSTNWNLNSGPQTCQSVAEMVRQQV